MGRNLLIFLSTAIIWNSFLHSSSTWILKLRCRSIVSTRCLWPSTLIEFPRSIFNEPSTILFVGRFPVTKRHFVLAAFVIMFLVADHCERSSRSCWRADVIPRIPFVTSDEKLRVVSSAEMSMVERWAAKGCAILTEICLSLENVVPFAYFTSLRLHRSYLSLPWMQRVNQSAYWGLLSRYISWKSLHDSRPASSINWG